MKLPVESFHAGASALARKIAGTGDRLAATGIVCEAHFAVAERSEVVAMRSSVARATGLARDHASRATGLVRNGDVRACATAPTEPALPARPELAALVRGRGGAR
jgi:hypothetical protein